MSSCHEAAVVTLNKLVKHGGVELTDNDSAILEKRPDVSNEHSDRLSQLYEAIFRGFFSCAAEGEALYPEHKVAERFRRTIEENYPEANEEFLKFARTYWTLRVLIYDLMEDDMEWIGAHLLAKLEQDIGPVFFPFPGPAKIPPPIREKTQREILQQVNADIDIEEFMKGNPILIRDRGTPICGRPKILFIIKSLIGGLLVKIFPSLGPKGVIDTQITIYKRLKKKFPTASENDLLNSLIMSRIKAPLSPTTFQEEYAHYEALLQDPNKTLKDVIWAIVEYEYLLSRGEKLHHHLAKIGAEPLAVAEELEKWLQYVDERIKELT